MKTSVPRLSPQHQRRGRLLERLDDGGPDQVTLVSAPAGYGKTQLLAEWASTLPDRTAWVSLDDGDNDDHRFWSGLLTALETCLGPDSPVHGLAVPGAPSADAEFLAAVAGIVDEVAAPTILVLDDVHELTATAPLRGLASLVRDRSPRVRLILSGRTDPPLPVARMRLGGELHEVRAQHLRFSVPEAEVLLAAEAVDVRPAQVRQLVEQTDGWAAGLRLAAMSLRDNEDPDAFLADLAGNGRVVSDYLVGEILSRLDPETLDVLRAASICDRLPAQLAAVLSGRPDAGEVLDTFERQTALVQSSGEGRVWYRIQPLLRAHLRADLHRRRPDTVLVLHTRAADWFDTHRRPVRALVHARRGGRVDQVAMLLRRHAITLIADGEHTAVRRALAWLDDQRDTDDPWFALVGALATMEAGSVALAEEQWAAAAGAWPPAADPELVELRDVVRSRRAALSGDPSEIIEATAAMRGRPGGARRDLDSMAHLDMALARAVGGRPEEGRELAEATLTRARLHRQGYLADRALAVLAAIAAIGGDYGRMVVLAEQADHELPGVGWGSTAAAGMSSALRAYGALLAADPARCLERLDSFPASGDGDRGPDDGREPTADGLEPVRSALRGAALADLGHPGDGLPRLAAARGAVGGRPVSPEFIGMIALLEHGVATTAGRGDQARAALDWAERGLGADAGEVLLLRARRHLDLGRWAAAADALAPVLDGSASVRVPWARVEASVLHCRLAVRTGRRVQARHDLRQALASAGSMSVVRPLAFGPPEVVDLLTRHLGGFGDLEPVACRALETRHTLPHGHSVRLTDRERDVLSLLPTQRSLEEIAYELTVSHSTVKSHLRAIYAKLDAGSRREAITTARRHGLLAAAAT